MLYYKIFVCGQQSKLLKMSKTHEVYVAIARNDSKALTKLFDENPDLVNKPYPVPFSHTATPLMHAIYLTSLPHFGLDVFDTILNYDVDVLKKTKVDIFEKSIRPIDYMIYHMSYKPHTSNDSATYAKYKYMILKVLLKGNGKVHMQILNLNVKITNLYHDCVRIVNHLIYEPNVDLKHSRFVHLIDMDSVGSQKGSVIRNIRAYLKSDADTGKREINKLLKSLCDTYSKL